MQKEDKKAEQREKNIEEKIQKKKEVRSQKTEKKEVLVKKWKGKDWFAIFSPDIFGKNFLSETPTTDPGSLVGRVIEVGVPELTGDQSKYYMKVRFRVKRVDEKNAFTEFYGFRIAKEFIFRMVRKGSQRVDVYPVLETKDGYRLRIGFIGVLNRNVETSVKSRFRKFVVETLKENTSRITLDDFVKGVIAGVIQRKIKKAGSKIYPVRFAEIEKIELKAGPGAQPE
jgi:small subunit ribosomal protein S3Ae